MIKKLLKKINKNSFSDGVHSLTNMLTNRRNILHTSAIKATVLSSAERTEIYKTGLGYKIVDKKAGYALTDSLQFSNSEDENFYNRKLDQKVKEAFKQALVHGRGIVVVLSPDADMALTRMGTINPETAIVHVFSGDMVTVQGNYSKDLLDNRYMKPIYYMINGQKIHWSHVVDFTYRKPSKGELASYQYGGISEFDYIYNQLVGDGAIERAGINIVERNSTIFYKLTDYAEKLAQKQDEYVKAYVANTEDMRNIYGAGIIDAADDIVTVAQTLSDLPVVDQMLLRRLAMVTDIPLSELVGENVRGLNSTGENEKSSYMQMVRTLQDDYLYQPINELMSMFNKGTVFFKDTSNNTAKNLKEKATYESLCLDNALKLKQLGENYKDYLLDKNIIKKEDLMNLFKEVEDEDIKFI